MEKLVPHEPNNTQVSPAEGSRIIVRMDAVAKGWTISMSLVVIDRRYNIICTGGRETNSTLTMAVTQSAKDGVYGTNYKMSGRRGTSRSATLLD